MGVRQSLIRLAFPKAPDAEPPICRWCGIEIVYVPEASGYRRTRKYHRGDKWEVGPTLNCRREHKQSFCWTGRDALRWQASCVSLESRYVLACVDCGQVVETGTANKRRAQIVYEKDNPPIGEDGRFIPYPEWEADHEHPIIDGGRHELENLRVRCVECHGAKTKREAIERAERRSKLPV